MPGTMKVDRSRWRRAMWASFAAAGLTLALFIWNNRVGCPKFTNGTINYSGYSIPFCWLFAFCFFRGFRKVTLVAVTILAVFIIMAASGDTLRSLHTAAVHQVVDYLHSVSRSEREGTPFENIEVPRYAARMYRIRAIRPPAPNRGLAVEATSVRPECGCRESFLLTAADGLIHYTTEARPARASDPVLP